MEVCRKTGELASALQNEDSQDVRGNAVICAHWSGLQVSDSAVMYIMQQHIKIIFHHKSEHARLHFNKKNLHMNNTNVMLLFS